MNSVFIGSSAQAQKLSDLEQQLANVNTTVSGLNSTVNTMNQSVTNLENAPSVDDVFEKTIKSEAAFYLDGTDLKLLSSLSVSVGAMLHVFNADALVTLPVMTPGTDYAIYATEDGLIASENFTVPDTYTAENSRRIGGFHYQDGVINEHSIYDLKYRPNVVDPRGMVRSPLGIWADIYLLNATPDVLGTSAYNATIADGDTPPKIPNAFGGDGVQQYGKFTQFIASRVLAAYGKRLPDGHEFEQIAFGTTTGYKTGSDPVTTKFDSSARSMIGCEQVSGHMYQWSSMRNSTNASGWAYQDVTDGEGQVYAPATAGVVAARLGGDWTISNVSGARFSIWNSYPWTTGGDCGARGVCDHFESF